MKYNYWNDVFDLILYLIIGALIFAVPVFMYYKIETLKTDHEHKVELLKLKGCEEET